MSYQDETPTDTTAVRFTCWACERCGDFLALETEDAEAAVLEAVTTGKTSGTHRCKDGALGLIRLRGACAPGWFPGKMLRTAETTP